MVTTLIMFDFQLKEKIGKRQSRTIQDFRFNKIENIENIFPKTEDDSASRHVAGYLRYLSFSAEFFTCHIWNMREVLV
jgi:hypothetical protein